MEDKVKKQIRVLQFFVAVLFALVIVLGCATWLLFEHGKSKVIDAERINIRERDGTLKAVLTNSANFSSEGDRAKQGGVPFSGLMFYNQEGMRKVAWFTPAKLLPTGRTQRWA